jgi:hypothetical protein
MKGESFDYDFLVRQLAEYDQGREEVFRLIHELERLAIQKYNLRADGEGFVNFKSVVKALATASAKLQLYLLLYRNAFVQHEYPEFIYSPPEGEASEKTAQRQTVYAAERRCLTTGDGSLTQRILARAKMCFASAIELERKK